MAACDAVQRRVDAVQLVAPDQPFVGQQLQVMSGNAMLQNHVVSPSLPVTRNRKLSEGGRTNDAGANTGIRTPIHGSMVLSRPVVGGGLL